MGEELGTTVNQNMGEELGNYVHQNFGTDRHTHHTVHANPPVEFRDRQTDRQTLTGAR